jgi:hypothetical protein
VKSVEEEELSMLLERKPVRENGASFPLTFFDEVSLHDNAVKGSHKLSNFKLKMRMVRDGGELFYRAQKGDVEAIGELAVLARNLTRELNLLSEREAHLVREITKSYDEWPVVLSLIDKTKDGKSWYSFLKTH